MASAKKNVRPAPAPTEEEPPKMTPRELSKEIGRVTKMVEQLEQDVSEKLGTTVEIKPAGKKGAGRLVISYMSHEHLDDLIVKLTR